MKILFFSDAHGNQYALRQLYTEIARNKPDNVIFGGDIFGYYYGQREILSLIRKMSCTCLLGNHDHYFLELMEGRVDEKTLVEKYGSTYHNIVNKISFDDKQFLLGLKSRYDMVVDGLHLVFVHGSIEDPLNGRIYPDTIIGDITPYYGIDYVFMGHTHHKLVLKLANGTVLLNAGSIGQQRDGKGCTYGIFDTESRKWTIKEILYDREALVMEIKKNNESEEVSKRLIDVLYRRNI